MKLAWQVRSFADHLDNLVEVADELEDGARDIGEDELADELNNIQAEAYIHALQLRRKVMKLVNHDEESEDVPETTA